MSGIIAQNTLDNSGLVKAPAGGGAWNFIKKLTASADGTLSFVNGASDVVLDGTYKEYKFTFNNIHPATDNVQFTFNMSIDAGSNYNVTKTTTNFFCRHSEDDGTELYYESSLDLAQSTAFQPFMGSLGGGSDECCSGELILYDPANTNFVKHFISTFNFYHLYDRSQNTFVSGYGNTTSAVDAIQFKMSADEIDLGDICLYGLTT